MIEVTLRFDATGLRIKTMINPNFIAAVTPIFNKKGKATRIVMHSAKKDCFIEVVNSYKEVKQMLMGNYDQS